MVFRRAWALMIVAFLSFTIPVIGSENNDMVEGAPIGDNVSSSIFAGFPPFSIENDTALIENASKYGWIGTGTLNDPILIRHLDIDGNGTLNGIKLTNISLAMELSNVTVNNISTAQNAAGIFIKNSTYVSIFDSNLSNIRSGIIAKDSGLVVNNSVFTYILNYGISAYNCSLIINGTQFYNNNYGLSIDLCNGSIITHNNFTLNDRGLVMDRSPSSSIMDNIVAYTTYYGLFLQSSNNARIERNQYWTNDIGLYLINSGSTNISNENHNNDGTGIYVRASDDTSVRDCDLIDGTYPIHYYLTNRGSIDNNDIRNGRTGIISSRSFDLIITGNIVMSSINAGIQLSYGANYNTVANNTINGPPIGIYISNAFGGFIKNNTISNSLNGIEVLTSYDNQLIGNNISDCTEDGIQVSRGGRNFAGDNVLTDNTQYGISWITSDYGSIKNNTITGSQAGIEYSYSDDEIISGNIVSSVGHGITLIGADRGTVENNSIMDTTGYGITLSESSGNYVANNTIMKCRFHGFKLLSSSDNVLYNNALAYNNKALDSFNASALQAIDNFASNEWYQNGRGNYWRDLTGPDDNEDSIVDVSYQIGNLVNSDPYPLTITEFKLVPSIVLNFTGVPIGGTSFLMWEPPMFNGGELILGYDLYRKNSTGKYQLIQELGPDIQNHFDLFVKTGETHYYQISAFNEVGEGPRSITVSVLPDITEPVITIITPEFGSIINSEIVHLTWKGTDPLHNILEYKVKLDDWDWMDVGLSTEIDIPVRGNGVHNITIWAKDVAGNTNQTNVEFTVDVELPTIVIGQLVEGAWINSSTAYFHWTMNDNYSGIHHIEIRWDDVYWLHQGTSTNITIKNLEEGPHIAYFKVIDNAGNEIIESINFTIDLQLPDLWIEYPENEVMINTSYLWFKWVGFDTQSGTKTFMIKVDDGNWIDIGIVYNTTVHLDGEGYHTVYLMLLDNAGNQAIVMLNVTLDKKGPEIISYGPTGYSIDPLTVKIFVELSELLDPNNMIFSIDGVSGSIFWDSNNRVYFSPNEQLKYGTTYDVTISGTDTAGNHLALFIWSFSTDDRGYIKGRVLDMSNFPIKKAKITIIGSNTTTPDGAGNFILTSISGPKTIKIEAPGFLPFSKDIVIIAGETYDLGPIKLEEKIDKGSIKGKLIDADGDPLLGVIVTLDTGETFTTDEEGEFEFYVEIGNYTISFERDGYKRRVENAWVKKDITLDLHDIVMESTRTSEVSDNGGIELWQMQLLIFFVIVIIGIIIIFYIMKRSTSSVKKIGEE